MCYIVTPWRGFGSGLGSALLLFWQIPRPPDCPSQTGSAALQPPAAKSRLRSGALIHGTCGPDRRPDGADPPHIVTHLNAPGQFRHGGPTICGRQMGTIMIPEKTQRLADLAEQLSHALMTAALCADEIRAIVHVELDSHPPIAWERPQNARHRNPPPERPLVDGSTFSVRWAGRTCCLRRTILFRLAQRLARHPNQYVTPDQLLHDVWDGGVKSPETIRSAVRHLRHRLANAGMQDLAAAIQGSGGCYGLILDGRV